MMLADILNADNISTDLASSGKMDVLAELAGLLNTQSTGLSTSDVTKILVERERLATTGVGEGVAIPHGKAEQLQSIKAAVGISRTGVPFDSVDGGPVHIFLALLAPTSSSGDHLKALARASRLLKNPEFRSRLLEARTSKAAFDVIREEDEKP